MSAKTKLPNNILYGAAQYGAWIYAGQKGIDGSGAGTGAEPDTHTGSTGEYYEGQFSVTAYNNDGTKTALFGTGAEENTLSKVTFEITETGCGSCQLTFKKLPTNAELTYRQRIDISLFGDDQPWYSGFIYVLPAEGGTDTEFVYKVYGYYDCLEYQLVFGTYENVDVAEIVRDIAKQAEQYQGLVYNDVKIVNVGYAPTKIVFDGVTVKEALDTLTDFALDYVYGVDEYRSIYFKPRDTSINEQARLSVGLHFEKYSPSWDADDIVNWARIKGGNIDDEGEQWLCVVEDTESQEKYGIRQEVWDLPEAYEVEDARRWGENQIQQKKDPTKSAKLTAVKLEYPYPDGTFNVRHMNTDGLAEIHLLDGSTEEYPITKIKYTISGEKGIQVDMELGTPQFSVDQYLGDIERRQKDAEQSQSSAIKQLSTTI